MPRRLLVLLVVAGGALGQGTAGAHAVVGGSPSTPGAAPWVLALLEAQDARKTVAAAQYCAGTLIAPDVLVTAAHCVQDDEGTRARASELRLFAGRVLPLRTGELRRVRAVRVHPDFDDGAGQANADIAVVRLRTPMRRTPTLALAAATDGPSVGFGQPLRLWGWGDRAKGEGQNFPRQLHDGTITRFTDTRCDDLYGRFFNPASQLCAGRDDGAVDACEGDSGGPLTAERPDGTRVLVGVVSYGQGCGEPEFPTVYTKVTRFRAFIDRAIAQTRRR